MAGALGIGLLGGHNADVIKEFMPKTAVKQMKGGVLHTAVIPIDGSPIFKSLF